jgi:hypothetical protein
VARSPLRVCGDLHGAFLLCVVVFGIAEAVRLSQRPQRQAEMQAALRDGSAVHHDPRGSVSTGVRDYVSPTPVVTVSPMIEAARIPAFAAPVMMAERIAVKPVSLLTPQTLKTNCHAA